MNSTRNQIDQIAWRTIHDKPRMVLANARGSRPLDYRQIESQLQSGVEFEHAWSNFLHAFYDYKDASFFALPSPALLSVEWQALLDGAAEWLSSEFWLLHPVWTNQRQYFLDNPWHPMEDFGLDMSEFMAEQLQKSPEAFRKRNIAFLSRNLIVL
jgi:hypothetical protein